MCVTSAAADGSGSELCPTSTLGFWGSGLSETNLGRDTRVPALRDQQGHAGFRVEGLGFRVEGLGV